MEGVLRVPGPGWHSRGAAVLSHVRVCGVRPTPHAMSPLSDAGALVDARASVVTTEALGRLLLLELVKR